MFAAEMISMIELLRGLAQRKNELDKEYFENFITPIWNAFNVIHNNYKETFQEYIKVAKSEDDNVDSLMTRVREDSIYTANMRAELGSLIRHTPIPAQKALEGKLLTFFYFLNYYFSNQEIFVTADENSFLKIAKEISAHNRPRYNIIISLARKNQVLIADPHRYPYPKLMPEADWLTDILGSLQYKYREVSNAYFDLRKEILT